MKLPGLQRVRLLLLAAAVVTHGHAGPAPAGPAIAIRSFEHLRLPFFSAVTGEPVFTFTAEKLERVGVSVSHLDLGPARPHLVHPGLRIRTDGELDSALRTLSPTWPALVAAFSPADSPLDLVFERAGEAPLAFTATRWRLLGYAPGIEILPASDHARSPAALTFFWRGPVVGGLGYRIAGRAVDWPRFRQALLQLIPPATTP